MEPLKIIVDNLLLREIRKSHQVLRQLMERPIHRLDGEEVLGWVMQSPASVLGC